MRTRTYLLLISGALLTALILWFNGASLTADWFRMLQSAKFEFLVTAILGTALYVALS